MASLNRVLLIGNLTRNPEIRYTPSGSAVCEFGIAVNRRFVQANGTEKDEACFIDIVVWGKQAESTSRFLQKGSSVFIEGRLVYDQWEEKETQKKRSRLRVNAERVQFLDRREEGRPQGGAPAEFPDGGAQPGGYQQYRGSRQDYGQRPQYRPAQNAGNGQGRQEPPAFQPQSAPQPQTAPQAAAPQAAAPQRPAYDEPPAMPSQEEPYVTVEGVEDDIPF